MNSPDILSKQKCTRKLAEETVIKRTSDVSATIPCIVGLLLRETCAKRYIRLLSAISIDWYFATHDYSRRRKRLKMIMWKCADFEITFERSEWKYDFYFYRPSKKSRTSVWIAHCENVPQ